MQKNQPPQITLTNVQPISKERNDESEPFPKIHKYQNDIGMRLHIQKRQRLFSQSVTPVIEEQLLQIGATSMKHGSGRLGEATSLFDLLYEMSDRGLVDEKSLMPTGMQLANMSAKSGKEKVYFELKENICSRQLTSAKTQDLITQTEHSLKTKTPQLVAGELKQLRKN